MSEELSDRSVASRAGIVLSAVGALVLGLSIVMPAAHASPNPQFQGACTGTVSAGTCVLDEPEGNDPSTQGTVTYALNAGVLAFTINAVDNITEVQICMQTSGPFDVAANACAGIHGNHVTFTQKDNVYSVDLGANGFNDPAAVYWTLHVVAGGRTLQVTGPGRDPDPTTTTTEEATTSTTEVAEDPTTTTSTTEEPTTTSTTEEPTTTSTTEAPEETTTTTEATTPPTAAPTVAAATEATTTTTGVPTIVLGERFTQPPSSTVAFTGAAQALWLARLGAILLGSGLLILFMTKLGRRRAS